MSSVIDPIDPVSEEQSRVKFNLTGYDRIGEKRKAQDEIYEGLIEYQEGVD